MKAIILAAWEGTRLHPITHEIPKAMVDVFGKPLLAHNMDKLAAYVDDFILVVKYKEEIIKEYFWDMYKWVAVRYHTQGEKKWTAWALEGVDITWDCFIIASDTIFHQSDIDKLVTHKGYWVLAKKVTNPEKYGIFEVDSKNTLQKVIEKPQTYIWNLASLFYFKLNTEIISHAQIIPVSQRWEYELTDALNIFCQTHIVSVLEIQHDYIDITSLEDLKKSHNYSDIKFGETRYIENIWENELYYWISKKHIEDIISYTQDSKDTALQKNTSDSKRFASIENMEKWYQDDGRRIFTLINPEWKLLWITYFRPSLMPHIIEITDTQLNNIWHTSTAAIRLYPIARGKWLATAFLQVSERIYRSEFQNTTVCVDIEEENIASRRSFEKAWYRFLWFGENKKSTWNTIHKRCIYIK